MAEAAEAVGMRFGVFSTRWPDLVAEINFPPPASTTGAPKWSAKAVAAWRAERSARTIPPQFIALTRGLRARVDPGDHRKLSAMRWFAVPSGAPGKFYAASTSGGQRIWMHRLLLGAPPDRLVDHRDGDGLHNCRHNLRLATPQQNIWNRAASHLHSYRGVQEISSGWRAAIWIDGRKKTLGVFASAAEAGAAYDAAAHAQRGAFARLNFRPTLELK